ncbi:CRC domain-containing protein TSO1 isoform X2 [Ricinus communis]|uniref:CRC domain-containing protein TSO1 isoform X2 n=1 Tax=Ricinus communis TaxID=3988 RepID=UPI000772B9B6|nr:CRC domain-containing protein TSO1 isoform X2 [Ricinus communis]|eukprot:XP_015572572.1 CRC domain-containing protein TSO1 isoform X1 [Ricinus communis]
MGSHTPAKTSTSPSTSISAASTVVLSDSSSVQESPFLNYINNLSPIKPVKVAHGAQGFGALSSPPLIFTSPRTLPERGTSFLQRSQLCQISSAEMPENDDRRKKLVDHSNDFEDSVAHHSRLITDTQKETFVKNSTLDQPGSSSGCIDEYLNDPVDVDGANCVNLTNSKAFCEQGDKSSQVQPSIEINLRQAEEEKCGSKQPFNECQNIESDLPVDHALENKQCDGLGTHIIQANEDTDENAAATTHRANQNIGQRDPEAGQLQRGMSRRCLQFEEARQKITLNRIHSTDPTNNVNGSGSPASTTELENLDSSYIEIAAYSHKKMINLSEPTTSMFPRFSGKSLVVVSKPSGIGLHLNSIVTAMPMGHSGAESNKSTPIMSCHQDAGDRLLEAQDSEAAGAASSESFHTAESLNILQPLVHHVTPLKRRNFKLEHADNFEEFSQLSPTKKRRKKSLSIDGDGCKRCNCKKTKCLKLYCDCFAAGIYCADPCACQDCFNRPEYEDTVLETRQQIESRNPLAFAPKIVQHAKEFAASREDRSSSMPSLSRHKRGCNCKKSMCLKKYCECYQANVGCSSECRCEGCKNGYGRKEEYGIIEETVSDRVGEERLEGRVDDKLAIVATDEDLLPAELYDLHNLTPSTPSFQHSDHGKSTPKSPLSSSRHVPSPESDISILPSNAKSTRSSRYCDTIPEASKETVDIDSCDQGIDYNVSEMMSQFSSKCSALADIYDPNPLTNPMTVTLGSSASSKTRDWSSGSRFQLCPGSGRLPSGRSVRWWNSPITPMTRLGENKIQGHDSDSGLYNILEDDTPEILKEGSTPSASVKASSPNKKRVSPPQNHIHDFRSSSSGGLKSGRKFILRSVPSFPPLTPCVNSEGIREEKQQL